MNIVPSLCELCQYGQKNGRICYMPGCKNGNKFKQRGVEDLEKENESIKQERNELKDQLAILRGALYDISLDRVLVDDVFVMTVASITASKALRTTPNEATERVNVLIEALIEVVNIPTDKGFYSLESVVRMPNTAKKALAEWRKNK